MRSSPPHGIGIGETRRAMRSGGLASAALLLRNCLAPRVPPTFGFDRRRTPVRRYARHTSAHAAELVNPEPPLASRVGADHFEARRFARLHEVSGDLDAKHTATVLRVRFRDRVAHPRAAVGALPRLVGKRYVEIEQRRSIDP